MNWTLTCKIVTVVVAVIPFKANACFCSEPGEPSIPSGHNAESYQMEFASGDVASYLNEMQDYNQCLSQCIDEAKSNAESIIEEWNSAIQQYKNR